MSDRERVEALAKVIAKSTSCIHCEGTGLGAIGYDADMTPRLGPCDVCTPIAQALHDSSAMRDLLADALREAQQVIAGEDTVEWARGADASYVSQSYAMRLLDDLIETTTEASDD